MPYEHPLAYLLGLEGMALLRAYAGEHGREFTEARLDEVRRLLDDPRLNRLGVDVATVDSVAGYREWASTYDGDENAAFADEPIAADMLASSPAGVALDAACGTGRHSSWLSDRGHRVIGVDSSAEMLEIARRRVSSADFRQGELEHLPISDESVDIAICALALGHVADLGPVFAEFARVLRPGGLLVTTDVHPDHVALGSVPAVRTSDGLPARIATMQHRIGDYIRAGLEHGLDVRRCEEILPKRTPVVDLDESHSESTFDDAGPWDLRPWSLMELVPAASAAVFRHVPDLLVLQFQKRVDS